MAVKRRATSDGPCVAEPSLRDRMSSARRCERTRRRQLGPPPRSVATRTLSAKACTANDSQRHLSARGSYTTTVLVGRSLPMESSLLPPGPKNYLSARRCIGKPKPNRYSRSGHEAHLHSGGRLADVRWRAIAAANSVPPIWALQTDRSTRAPQVSSECSKNNVNRSTLLVQNNFKSKSEA